MSVAKPPLRSLDACLRCVQRNCTAYNVRSSSIRTFSTTAPSFDESQVQQTSTPPLDPNLVSTPREERKLVRTTRTVPIGSRRRRAALQSSSGVPFEQLPYQCFQEARKVLQEDREEKLREIEIQRGRIERLKLQDASISGGDAAKHIRLRSMQKRLEELKILADINDPIVKKRFEDGLGDMNKPIYRYLADRKWRSYDRPVLMQRLTQMHVVPDLLPKIDPIADVRLEIGSGSWEYGSKKVQPGEFVNSRQSLEPPRLWVQPFDKEARLVTVVVVDPDVPAVEKDGFDYRCHYLACNIPVTPTQTKVMLKYIYDDSQLVLPWLPPYALKGSPYHRLPIFILEQQNGKPLDVASIKAKVQRDGFVLRSFMDKHGLRPFGAHMFRTQWDENTAAVMKWAGIEGADIELKRKRIEPLPYKKKDGERYR